jgi:hypothetical protein
VSAEEDGSLMTKNSLLAGSLLTLLLLTACGYRPPGGQPPPDTGTPALGVDYRISPACTIPLRLGDTWWEWRMTGSPWPRPLPVDDGKFPYPVPGVVRLTTANEAVFRADVDGSELDLYRVTTPTNAGGCL